MTNFIQKGTEDTLLYADAEVLVSKHTDKYIMTVSSDLKTQNDESFSHNRCEFESFTDFEDFIKNYSPRRIEFAIYKAPVYEGDI